MSREGGTSFHGQLQMAMEHKLESFHLCKVSHRGYENMQSCVWRRTVLKRFQKLKRKYENLNAYETTCVLTKQ